MKTILVILMLLIMVSAMADEIDKRTPLHIGGGFMISSFNHILLSNISFTKEYTEDWNFYLTFTELAVYELASNDWQGLKFWDFTGSIIGMSLSRTLWQDSRPRVYPKYYGQKNGIGLEFAFQF